MRIIVGNQRSNLMDTEKNERTLSDYKLTAFCIMTQTDDGFLLCHCATGELVLLREEEYQAICSGEPLKGSWAKVLSDHLFLPHKDEDEYAKVDCERKEAAVRAKEDKAITEFTVLPTTRCNARCFYCYEKGILQRNMSAKTADDTAEFIARKCNGQKVRLSWFGGEPTVAHPIITRICKRLQEKNIAYDSGMISNGLLFDRKLIKTAKDCWKLKRIQITIDGTKEVYNSTKNYKGFCSDPYGAVLSNIKCLMEEKIFVTVRINVGVHNDTDVSKLIQQLSHEFGGNTYFSLYVHEIDNYYPQKEYEELINRTTDFTLKLMENHMRPADDLPSIRLHSCMADSESSILINPDGQLGKCEHYAYEKLCGSIYDDHMGGQMIEEWKEAIRFPQCGSCPLYASCIKLKWCNGGSCRCNDAMIKSKVTIVVHSMQRAYARWKKENERFRNRYYFEVPLPIETEQDQDMFLVSFGDKTVNVNQVAVDILLFLRNKHSFSEIVKMLTEKYDTSSFQIEDDIEQYLCFLLHEGICVKEIPVNEHHI